MLLTDGSSNRAQAQEKRYGLVSAGVSRLVVNRADALRIFADAALMLFFQLLLSQGDALHETGARDLLQGQSDGGE